MPHVSIATGCYNEEDNVEELHAQICAAMTELPGYTFEVQFIDNASTDGTVAKLRALAAKDPRVRFIVNARNYGHIRSPYHGILQCTGDVVIVMASDLQEPPALIPAFVKKWEEGYKIVAGIKTSSAESRLMYAVRSFYYGLVARLADVDLLQHFTGFGLYDRSVLEVLRSIEDPYPYLRGLISELGFEVAKVSYKQKLRQHGRSKSTFYVLYDMAILGITTHSRVPMRLASIAGFVFALLAALAALVYLVLKLAFWSQFQLGLAPVLIGLFLMSSALLFFIGIIGEYVTSIQQHVRALPLVVEHARINFPASRRRALGRPVAPAAEGRPVARATPAAPEGS